MENLKRIDELKDNKEFLEKIGKTTNVEEISMAFAEEGIEVTPEQIKEAKIIAEKMEVNDGELVENELDMVSGGSGTVAFLIKIGGVLFLAYVGGKILKKYGN